MDEQQAAASVAATLAPSPRTGREPDAVVVIPAFNEAARIGEVVHTVLQSFEQVVVIDDGSRDDTAAVARSAGARVLVHPVNLGQGAALQTGFEWARRNGVAWIVTLDADGQHDPVEAAAMLEAARRKGWEIGLGSRFLGRTVGMPGSRRVLLKVALAFQNLTTGLRLTDVHNGLRVLSRTALETIVLRQNRMAHASEIVSQIAASGLRVGEHPVTIRYTAYSMAKGQSAMGALHILFDLLVARLGR